MKYEQVEPGQWVSPIRKGYKMACCSCGLVHRMDFRIVKRGKGYTIQFRAHHARRETAAIRRRKHDYVKAKDGR